MLKPAICLQAFGANANRKWHRGRKVNWPSKILSALSITDIIRNRGKDYYPISAFLVCSAFVTFLFSSVILSCCIVSPCSLASPPSCPVAALTCSTESVCFFLYLRHSCRLLALHWCSREATIIQTNREFLSLQENRKDALCNCLFLAAWAGRLPPLLLDKLRLLKTKQTKKNHHQIHAVAN